MYRCWLCIVVSFDYKTTTFEVGKKSKYKLHRSSIPVKKSLFVNDWDKMLWNQRHSQNDCETFAFFRMVPRLQFCRWTTKSVVLQLHLLTNGYLLFDRLVSMILLSSVKCPYLPRAFYHTRPHAEVHGYTKPAIAQLVERRTVVGWLSGILRSAVRLRLAGSG